jgi:type IV secretory pathway component VirB8
MRQPYQEQGQPYRLLLWLTRWSLVANAVQAVMLLCLGAALTVVAHRDNLRPFFITADVASNRVFRVEPAYGNVKTFDLSAMALSRRYVVLRETLDFATEESRWTEASWLAGEKVSEEFKSFMSGKNSPLQSFKQRGRKRSIEILSSPKISDDGPSKRTHLVEFKTIDTEPNGFREEKIFQAVVVTEGRDSDVKFNDALLNPYGITVLSYTVNQKKG